MTDLQRRCSPHLLSGGASWPALWPCRQAPSEARTVIWPALMQMHTHWQTAHWFDLGMLALLHSAHCKVRMLPAPERWGEWRCCRR